MSDALEPPQALPAVPAPTRRQLARAVREGAKAVRHIHDLATFFGIFRGALEHAGICGDAEIRSGAEGVPSAESAAFAPGRLVLPIAGGPVAPAMAVFVPPPDKRHFDAEDVHLLGALSELLASVMDVTRRIERSEREIMAMKAVLNLAPVGICLVDKEGRVEVINALARHWLGLAEREAVATALPAGIGPDDMRRGATFHLRVGGRLLFCQTEAKVGNGLVALVVTDLTPEQGRLLDVLQREIERANALRRPLHFVVLERVQPTGALLAALTAIRTELGSGVVAGPYDASRLGLVFRDVPWSGAIAALRRLPRVLPPDQVRVGWSSLARFDESAEAMIQAALDWRGTLADVARPRVLVQDAYRGVGDAVQMMLRPVCDVVGCTEVGAARVLLQQEHFDAVLVDGDLAAGPELVAWATARNESLQAFYLSGRLLPALSGQVARDGVTPVFSKPFDVAVVRDRILSSLISPTGAEQK